MIIDNLLADKNLKAKAKVQALSKELLLGNIKTGDLIQFAINANDSEKGTCVEALEAATKANPEISDQKCFDFSVACLSDKAPRVKWEAAKVIANTAGLYKTKLNKAIIGLLKNTEDPGTVVRWAAAQALARIIILNTNKNSDLIPAAEAIVKREEDNAIKKIYLVALKKVKS